LFRRKLSKIAIITSSAEKKSTFCSRKYGPRQVGLLDVAKKSIDCTPIFLASDKNNISARGFVDDKEEQTRLVPRSTLASFENTLFVLPTATAEEKEESVQGTARGHRLDF
jgi:hypothetical protein